MLQLDLPHLNVLTKIDNLSTYPPLSLPLSFYTEARSLEHILPHLEAEQRHQELPILSDQSNDTKQEYDNSTPGTKSRFSALNEAIIELVEEYGLVGFETLAVEDRQSMIQLLRAVDRAGGYAFGPGEGVDQSVWQVAVREGGGSGNMEVRDIEDRWIDRREEFDEQERKMWEEEGKYERESELPRPSGTTTHESSARKGGHNEQGAIKVVRKEATIAKSEST